MMNETQVKILLKNATACILSSSWRGSVLTGMLMFLILLPSFPLLAYTNYNNTMRDFMGCNQNIRIMDYSYGDDFRTLFRWERDYMQWSWFYERIGNGQYNWNLGWPKYDDYTAYMKSRKINMLMVVEGAYSALNVDGYHFPKDKFTDGSQENHYRERINFVSQAALRFGPSGLNRIKYFEDANEPDGWWHELWPADRYAKYVNGFHDGQNCTIDANHPVMGVKSADPQAIHVMGGGVNADYHATEGYLTYLNNIRSTLGATRFNQVVEVLNFHFYCGVNVSTPGGFAPEHGTYGLKNPVDRMKAWRDSNAPGKPIWLTEFGWDSAGPNSFVYARSTYNDPQRAQANYLMRSFALLKGWGIDKAFVFQYEDYNSGGNTQFDNCGMIRNSANGLVKKTSFYYLATMANLIGDLHLKKVDKYADGTPQVYSYVFTNAPGNRSVYMVWCRNALSDYDDNTSVASYTYSIPNLVTCTQIVCTGGSTVGTRSAVTVNNAGTASASVSISLNETPRFLITHSTVIPPSEPSTRPISLSATKAGLGTNQVFWTPSGASGTYKIYVSTTAPINDGNKGTAVIAASGLAIGLSSYRHSISALTSTPYWYAVTVCTGVSYEFPLKSGTNALSYAVTNRQSTRPLNLITGKSAWGTNMIAWSPVGTSGTHKIYFSTSGPITDANKGLASVLASGLPIGLTTYKHAVSELANTPYWYAVTVRTGASFEFPLWSGTNTALLPVTNRLKPAAPLTMPTNLLAVRKNPGTNRLTWTALGTNGKYRIYCSTNGPVNDANKSSAIVLSTNFLYSSSAYNHVLSNHPLTRFFSEKRFWYGVTLAQIVSTGGGPSSKISLNPSMVTKESGPGDAGMLVDENAAVGDPPTGSPSTFWNAEWSGYPHSAYIDLGQPIQINKIHYFAGNDSGEIRISHGSPGSWSVLITDNMMPYNIWTSHDVSVTTRYVRVTVTSGGASTSLKEIVLYGASSGSSFTQTSLLSGKNSTITPVTNRVPLNLVPPTAPILLRPLDGFGTNSKKIRLVWNRPSGVGTGLLDYEVLVAGNSHITTMTNIVVSNIPDGQGKWKVRARDTSAQWGSFSISNVLNIDCQPPNVPGLVWPMNTTNRTLFQQFTWTRVSDVGLAGVAKYQIVIDATTNMVMGTANTNYSVSLSEAGHSWRVRAVDAFGNVGAFSVLGNLLIDQTAPTIVSLTTPDHGAGVGTSVSLGWTPSSDAGTGVKGYLLQTSSLSDFSVASVRNVVSTSLNTNLVSGSTLWWRVRAYDKIGNTNAWSVSRSLVADTNTITVSPLIPQDFLLTNANVIGFGWTSGSGWSRYHLEIRSNSISGKLVFSATNITLQNHSFGTFNDGSYVWRVRAFKGVTSTWQPWSAVRNFAVDTSGPTTPAHVSPMHGSFSRTVAPRLEWSASSDVSGIAGYDVEIGMRSTNLGALLSFDVPGAWALSQGSQTWRVRSRDSLGNPGAWSSGRTFVIDSLAPAPVSLTLPLNGILVESSTAHLSWTAATDTVSGVSNYLIQWANNPAFISANQSKTNTPGKILNGLSSFETNWWRVRAVDRAGNTNAWSSVWSFRVDSSTALPVLLSPFHLTETSSNAFDFRWSKPVGVSRFWFELRTNSPTGTVVFSQTNLVSTNLNRILSPGLYFWRVRAFKDSSSSWKEWTSFWSLRCVDLSVPNPPVIPVPEEDSIVFWPNPFDRSLVSSMKIRYRLSETAKVKLSIFTLEGKLVREWEQGFENDGMIEWDGKNSRGIPVVRGTYFLMLRVDGVVLSGKVFKLGVVR